MAKSFFRQEALDAATRVDETQRTMRVSTAVTRLSAAALATALAGVVTWSAFVDVPIHVTGHGVLARSGETLISPVRAASSGYVAEVLVKRGDTVAAGDVLLRLSQPERMAALKKAERILEVLSRNAERSETLRAEDAEAESRSHARQLIALGERIEALSSKKRWLDERRATLEKLHADGIVSLEAVSNARIAADVAEDDLAAARAAQVALDVAREEAASERERAALSTRLELERLQAEVAEIRADLEAGSTVTADAPGRVIAINTRLGALAAPGQPLLEILVDGTSGADPDALEAVVFVPLSQGKRLSPDDRALLTPADLPLDRHDRLIARVISISEVPASSQALQFALGDDTLAEKISAGGPTFEVRLAMERKTEGSTGYAWTGAPPPGVTLSPGTPLSADVTVERRPLLALAVPALKRFLHLEADDWTGRP
ncbi:NHLP bacteriocin system secretion protein [Stappia stellulata]|uniref:NHLP bacteriocin system secretion protein n=1 Tax=Stappia stellulata TaxID=71235 RepID=UPI001CD48618|nr:NHLP bacteriocin system secretion protein [Stappia stellulata]MCA1242208.1 NHLP bacteriocin system secretion protein [Stappia stellulata]